MKRKLILNLKRMALLSLMLSLAVPVFAEVTGSYNSTDQKLYFTGTGEITQSIVRSISGYSQAKYVSIGSGITSIGSQAFRNTNIQSVTIPSNVTQLGTYAFADCKSLSTILINTSETTLTIKQYCFGKEIASMSSYVETMFKCFRPIVYNGSMADTKYSGGQGLFYSDGRLYFVMVGDYMQEIPENSFYSCGNLREVYFSEATKMKKIGASAFYSCIYLTSITLPSALETIDSRAFSYSQLASITIPSSVTQIGTYAFYGCNNMSNITLSSSSNALKIYGDAFGGCGSSSGLTFNYNRSFSYTYLNIGLFESNTKLKNVVVGSSVTSIPKYLCRNCTSLETVDMTQASKLTSINESAFSGCTSLQSAVLPSSLTTVGNYAFKSTAIKSVTFPYNVTSIGTEAFYGCSSLATARIKGNTTVGTNAFPATTQIINEFETYQGWLAYYKSFSNVTNLYIPNDNIANRTYSSSANLNTQFPNVKIVTFGKDVTKLGDYIFLVPASGTPNNIETVIFEGDPKDIGRSAFCRNKKLTSVVGSVKSVYEYSFAYSDKLSSIALTNDTKIDNYAFDGCTALSSVRLSPNLTEIGQGAFRDCTNLTGLYLPASITTIGNNAFYNCTGLKSINIPSNVSSLHSAAFTGCTNLKSVTINSNLLTSATYTSDSNLSDIFYYATNIEFGPAVKKFGDYAFYGSTRLASITLSEGLTEIGDRAFASCPLTELTLPESVTTCNIDAFRACGQLKKLTINGNGMAAPEGDNAYCDVDNILWRFGSVEEIVFGKNVTKVGYQACGSENLSQDYIRLKKVTFLGCPEIAVEAFYACYKLATIEGEVKSVASYSFAWTAITSISISDDTCIEKSAFDNCDELVSVTLPSNLEIIKESAFNECTALTQITLPATLKTIENWAFDQCENLRLVICESAEPADLTNSTNAFRGVPITEATLKVPYNGLEAYKSAVVWKDFFKYIANDGIYLADGEKYNCTKAYDNVPYIQYTRTFSEKTAGNWQCLYVPFDIDIDDELLEQCDLAEIYTVSFRDEDGDGMITDNDPLAVIISKAQSGMTYRGNTPYLIRAHNAGEVVIENTSTSLYKSDSESISCSSMKEQFIFKGIYTTTTINNRYTLNVDGQMSLYTQNTNLKPNRWYLEVKSRNGDESLVNRRFEILVDGEDDMTGIIDLSTSSSDSNDIYSVDGRKVDDINRPGIYIKNGKKVYVK